MHGHTNPKKNAIGSFRVTASMVRWMLCRFALSRGPHVLVQRTAVPIDYVLIRFRENVGNGLLPLKDVRHT
jgi:hypothetical protein